MTMQAAMIYAQSNVAAMIAARLTKSKGVEYTVQKVTTGFQVAPINKLPPVSPVPIVNPVKTWEQGDALSIELKFRGESKSYVDAFVDDKPVSFGKSTLIAWEVKGDRVVLRMPKATAKKRGLIH